MDFEENSPFQEGVLSETYQRPDKSFFKEPQELESLICTGRPVQKFLPKQADIDKNINGYPEKSIQRNTFTCYCKRYTIRIFSQPFYKDIYLYFSSE